MERGRGETRVLGQKDRNQTFAKGIERGKGGRCHAEGASFRIFRDSRVQNGATKGNPSFGAGRRGRGRASHPPPARLLASRASAWRGAGTKAAEKAFEGRDGLGSAPHTQHPHPQ